MIPDTLVLLGGIDWLGLSMQASGLVDVERLYKPRNKLTKPLFKLQYHTNMLYRYRHIWYGDWKNRLDQYRTIIIFDVFEDIDVIKYIQRHFPKIRIIVYYYNPIYNKILLNKIILTGVEIWSFDFSDCKEYGLLYNPQFYFQNIVFPDGFYKDVKLNNNNKFDLIFVGKDKGRMPLLMKLNEYFKTRKVCFFMGVRPDRNIVYSKKCKQFLIEPIPYKFYLRFLKNSSCVLDIVQKNQLGLTLRIMEALFYNKKVITNNTAIQNLKIYDKRNVYILGSDDRDLAKFIKSPVHNWNRQIKGQYVFFKWINRFFDSNSDTEGL